MSLFTSVREKRLWIVAASYLGAIYVSLYFVQFALDYLRERNLLRSALLLLFGGTAALILVGIWRSRPGWREWAVLATAAAVYLVVIDQMEILQERLHILEYGALALLLRAALVERWSQSVLRARWQSMPALWAGLATGAAGWIDEGIQKILPNRVYDLRDVAFNLGAGLLALAVVAARGAARARDHRAKAAESAVRLERDPRSEPREGTE